MVAGVVTSEQSLLDVDGIVSRTMKEMAGGEVAYGGWLPVNSESNNPFLTLVDNPPITRPLTQDLDFPYFEEQQEEIRPVSSWQESNAVLERQQEEVNRDWASGPINPWQQTNSILEPQHKEINGNWVSRLINPWQQSNSVLERQQEGGLFPFPLQLSPQNIALGGIILSLVVTAVIGWIHSYFIKSLIWFD